MYLLFRLFKTRDYSSHFAERLGFLPQRFNRTNPGAIWLHAVSVGEIASAIPLIEELRAGNSFAPIYLSTSTVAGRELAERRASSLVSGIFYCPLDYVSCIRRTLDAIRPALLIVFETEIWPNLYAETKRSGASLAIANARISDRTWPRYHRLRFFFGPVLQLSDAIFTQSTTDRDRYIELGVRNSRLTVAGNLKYDIPPPSTFGSIPTFSAERVWVAASTAGPNEPGSMARHSIDEDQIVIQTFKALAAELPHVLLILAPRQPARFEAAARALNENGISFLRLTDFEHDPSLIVPLPGVLLLDTIGDLPSAFRLAHVVFVGGSLAPRGGHNILEPAAAGVPIVIGSHMENFVSITSDFLESGALVQIQNPDELLHAVRRLLQDRPYANELGKRARECVERHKGVSRLIARELWPLYHRAFPKLTHTLLARILLRPLTIVWRIGGAIRRRRSERHAAGLPPLSVPVLSIGGITVGGSGKTPLTNRLAACLKSRGYTPGILTRGYGRRSPAENLILRPGAYVPTASTGDEAQIFLRAGIASVGIGADRNQTAKVLLAQFPSTDILLLDDGFQHARVKRTFDVVVIDGLDPFGEDELVPLGRLREPLESLARADALVITRAEAALRYEAISACLRDYNPFAPIFRARVIPHHWCDFATGKCMQTLPTRRVAAFCGLGNPQNFWNTLESLGLEVVFSWTFDDHHPYKPVELQRIAHQARVHGAEILVTTEKDRLNCPRHLERAIAPLDLAWLAIDLEIEDEPAFFKLLDESFRRHSVEAR